jgi:creatinine amidohydrolase
MATNNGAGARIGRHWASLSWTEIRSMLGEGSCEVGLVPVGATEQHGPHLPTATDTIIAEGLCDRVSERTGALVLPAISVACSYGHSTEFPGTLSLSPELLAAVVRQYAEWAATSGLNRLLFVNSHYGNTAALGTATDHLRLFRPDLRVGVADWWALHPDITAELTADGGDVHANRAETSLMLALAPHLVQLELAADADDDDRTGDLVFRYTAASLSRNGVTGRPSEATAELGHRLLEHAVERICSLVERGRQEEPPLGQAPFPSLKPSSPLTS